VFTFRRYKPSHSPAYFSELGLLYVTSNFIIFILKVLVGPWDIFVRLQCQPSIVTVPETILWKYGVVLLLYRTVRFVSWCNNCVKDVSSRSRIFPRWRALKYCVGFWDGKYRLTDSSFSIMTLLWAGWSGVRVSAGAENICLHHRVQTGSRTHPASYPVGDQGLFAWGQTTESWSWPFTWI
jgi:hypothetical protein